MARIEITVNRTSNESGVMTGSTVGIISFEESDPANVIEPNPIDYKTLITLKKFIDAKWKEKEQLEKEM